MHVSRDIGISLELKERARNNSKWRYIRSHVQNGDKTKKDSNSFMKLGKAPRENYTRGIIISLQIVWVVYFL